jgi:hypothetical protein
LCDKAIHKQAICRNWYISTKHIYVSDEYNIWKSPLGNYKKKHKKKQ